MTASELLAAEAARIASPDIQYERSDGVIDLTWGHPDPSTFAVASIQAAAAAVLDQRGWQSLTYGAPAGAGRTRSAIAEHLTTTDTTVEPAEVVVTAGSSGGLDLFLTMFASPGDVVLVEQPTYFLALRLFADHGLHVIGLESDGIGPLPASLDERAAAASADARRGFLYLVPTFANPTGRCMPAERQHELLGVARMHGIRVIEDDVYRDTAPNPPPSMWSLDRETVTRLGSFSKSLSPGLRIGFVTGGAEVIDRIGGCGLLDSGGGVNHFASMVVAEILHSGCFHDVAAVGHHRYAERRAVLADALDRSMFRFEVPEGGYFLWLELPDGVSSTRMVEASRRYGVLVSDGSNFFVGRPEARAVRVSFSMLESAVLSDGAARLNDAVASLVLSGAS